MDLSKQQYDRYTCTSVLEMIRFLNIIIELYKCEETTGKWVPTYKIQIMYNLFHKMIRVFNIHVHVRALSPDLAAKQCVVKLSIVYLNNSIIKEYKKNVNLINH